MHECAYRVRLMVATVAAYITSKWNLLCTSQPRWYRHEKIAHGRNQSSRRLAGPRFFSGSVKAAFSTKVWRPSSWVGVDWWRSQLAIDTMREFMLLLLVALINNWWLHGRSEIQFLAEWLRGKEGHCQNYVISIGWVAFSTEQNSTAPDGIAML